MPTLTQIILIGLPSSRQVDLLRKERAEAVQTVVTTYNTAANTKWSNYLKELADAGSRLRHRN